MGCDNSHNNPARHTVVRLSRTPWRKDKPNAQAVANMAEHKQGNQIKCQYINVSRAG